jgi:subtilisin-like proprotein convertase family protein
VSGRRATQLQVVSLRHGTAHPQKQGGSGLISLSAPASPARHVHFGHRKTAFSVRTAVVLALLICATAAFAGPTQAASATKKTYSNSTAVPIPDMTSTAGDPEPGFTSSAISVSGLSGNITKVTASFHIEYDQIGDLEAGVVAPDQNTISLLFFFLPDTGDDFGTGCGAGEQTTMDDSGADGLIDNASAPYVGSFLPTQAAPSPTPLSVFNGLPPNGDWNFTVVDVGLGGTGSLDCWSITIDTDQAEHVTFSSDTPMAIIEATPGTPTNTPGVASSPVTVAGLGGWISKVTVSLYITHTSDSDLDLTLTGPGGQKVALTRAAGGQGDNFGAGCASNQRTNFDDAAAKALVDGAAPFVGTFRPQSPLAKLNGLTSADVNGTWTLDALDNHVNNTGIIKCWSLMLTMSSTAVPTLPDLQVKTGLSLPRFLPGTYNYVALQAINNTANSMSGVTVTTTLPSQLTDVTSAPYYPPECGVVGQQVTCTFGSLAAGEIKTGWARVFIPTKNKFCIQATAAATGVAPVTTKPCFNSTTYVTGDQGTGYNVGDIAHDFALQDQNGNPVKLSQFKGKYVLLEWSSVWCGPSQFEVPQDRDEVKALNSGNVMGVEVVYLQVLLDGPTPNVPSTQKNAKDWVTHFNLTTPVLFTANDTNQIALQQHTTYTITGGEEQPAVPVSVFIDPAGKIFHLRVGATGDTTAIFESQLP